MKVAKGMLVLAMVLSIGFVGCSTNFSPLRGGEVNAVLVQEPMVEMRVAEPTTVAIKDKVLFAFDKYNLDDQAMTTVSKVADLMKKYPDTVLALEGYTDKYGSAEYNMKLSINRANAVKNALVNKGIESDRIASVKGFGKTKLIPNLSNRENRRVIILSVGDK